MFRKVNLSLMFLLILIELTTLILTILILVIALQMDPESKFNKHRTLNIFSALFSMLQVKNKLN